MFIRQTMPKCVPFQGNTNIPYHQQKDYLKNSFCNGLPTLGFEKITLQSSSILLLTDRRSDILFISSHLLLLFNVIRPQMIQYTLNHKEYIKIWIAVNKIVCISITFSLLAVFDKSKLLRQATLVCTIQI